MNTQGVSPAMRRAIDEAAQWYATLAEQQGQAQDHAGLRQWLSASPLNGQAWERVQQVRSRFAQVPGKVAAPVLTRPAPRRTVLRGLLGLASAGLLGTAAHRHVPWREWRADLRTSVGGQRRWTLDDGSLLVLNTQSAADILFDRWQRQVILIAGEILIDTHEDDAFHPPRPFIVQTPHGSVRALGTRFVVRLHEGRTQVQVLQDAVEVRPLLTPGQAQRLESGQQAVFDAGHARPARSLPGGADAWVQSRLSVLDMPMRDFLAELGRYRGGYLGCDDSVAGIRVSGVFPLQDTDEALAVLADAFPVRVERLTRYWTRIAAR